MILLPAGEDTLCNSLSFSSNIHLVQDAAVRNSKQCQNKWMHHFIYLLCSAGLFLTVISYSSISERATADSPREFSVGTPTSELRRTILRTNAKWNYLSKPTEVSITMKTIFTVQFISFCLLLQM